MRPAESNQRHSPSIRYAGQNRPGHLSRFYAQSLRSGCFSTLIAYPEKPPSYTRGLLPISNGASPVASALGFRSGATPRGCTHSNRFLRTRPSKPDNSILLGAGHFYFALTVSLVCAVNLQEPLTREGGEKEHTQGCFQWRDWRGSSGFERPGDA